MLIDLLSFLPLAILTNTAFPFPFDYVLIFFAENYEPHQVWVFAALGSVCAAIAGFVDIKVLTAVGERTGRGKRWRAWNLDRSWFYAAVFLCAFLPVPYLLVRLVLVLGSPHPVLYAATLGSARLPRYVIIVYFWQQLNLPPWASAALVASALPFGLWHWWHGSSSPASLPMTPPDAP